ncbi:unnamed protein product, partial [Mycena citricolor]
ESIIAAESYRSTGQVSPDLSCGMKSSLRRGSFSIRLGDMSISFGTETARSFGAEITGSRTSSETNEKAGGGGDSVS